MMNESRSGVSAGSTGWILLTLLVISIFINYVDRSNLSIAAPIIQKEMHFLCYRRGDAGMRAVKAFREWIRTAAG